MKTTLVIDDDVNINLLFKTFLESKLNMQVLTAFDGLSGVEIFQENINKVNIVILDMTLPKLSGEEVFQKIKELKKSQKIIIVSGYPAEYFMNRITIDNNTSIFPKPTPILDIIKLINDN